jgi:DNA invertase Pin-like site-specific DNA recombinase
MPFVEEFYVIAESGICYYAKALDKEIDQSLLSAFLSTLSAFSLEISGEQMSSYLLHKRKYTIAKAGGLLFVARTDPKIKDRVVQKELAEMEQIFNGRFSPSTIASSWNGNVAVFRGIDPQLDRFFVASAAQRMASMF